MGIREWTNNHPRMTGAIATGCVVLCIAGIVYEIFSSRKGYPARSPSYFFTTDDGKSWFAASSENYPPFDHGGQTAVRAYVFACGSKQFVGYLERYNADVKKDLSAGKPLEIGMIRYGRELKRPGDTAWVKSGDVATETKIENIACPDGSGSPMAVNADD